MYVGGVGLVKIYKALIRLPNGALSSLPSDPYVRSFLCPFLYFNETLLHQSSGMIKPSAWSQS